MDHPGLDLYLGDTKLNKPAGKVTGEPVTLLGEQFYRIRNFDRMPAFFMSIVSSSDHWMFISSTGGLTAGRASAESALFPYYTDDRVAENYPNTGHVAVLRVEHGGRTCLWEPFTGQSARPYRVERNIYKNSLGDKLVFEETNHDLGLTYRYAWRSSERFGWVKTSWLVSTGKKACRVDGLDGLQNILPSGTSTNMQNTFSNLLNAYKRNELDLHSGLATFSLSSSMSDLPEPSESLRATTVWQIGLEKPCILLSSEQLDEFRAGGEVVQETDVRGRRGAYLAQAGFSLGAGEEKSWSFVAELNQDSVAVAALINQIKKPGELKACLESDIASGSAALWAIVASADGLQFSADRVVTAHHFSNVLFNTMRGGIFARNYRVRKADLLDFMAVRNRDILRHQADFFAALPDEFDSPALLEKAACGPADLERLCSEYLPLTFGRRHGDPSRPWNHFSINLKKPDGSQKLDYQGNWRDIFQNWEPLAWSYPEFTEQFICKFLNATTADGYNPYRVTRDGIEWEFPTPNDPWANIGYWGDHQIIYLEKLLEVSDRFHPGRLGGSLDRKVFSHANVPYRLKEYESLLADWYNTITFDRELDARITVDVKALGTDGKLLHGKDGTIFHVSLAEKLLALLLAKLGNFIPEGGIWMNTQRPEWNDGNNALVGKGISVVTLGYLRRYVVLCRKLFAGTGLEELSITRELGELFHAMHATLQKHRPALKAAFDDLQRRSVMDELGEASSAYRWGYYRQGFSGQFAGLGKADLLAFLDLALEYIEHSLKANERPDGLFHAYN
ncbi:MAG TPA: hypothetical protein VMC09_12345, partial [Anaerolineales bacterium]|nr:hypothetical protein [Anaerolineales bacterium]